MNYQEVIKREKIKKKGGDTSKLTEAEKPVRVDYEMRRYYIAAGVLSVMFIFLSAALFMQLTQKYGSMTEFMKTEITAKLNDTAEGIRGGLEEYTDKIPYIGGDAKAADEEEDNEEKEEPIKEWVLPTVEPPNTYQ